MSNKGIKVDGELGLYRDLGSGGIYADDTAYARYKIEKEKRLREVTQESRINTLEQKMTNVQNGINELLSILRGKQ